jgi:ParB family transcriptional regulator, chromosome partitioning protein
MSKKLAAKASLIQMPPLPSGAAAAAVAAGAPGQGGAAEHRPKTAPGSMAHFMASQSTAVKEADDLRERLKAFEGATPVRPLDPATVRPSRWANRHEASFSDAAFELLKAEIDAAGGNVQPVSVRPVAAMLNGSTAPGAVYELVFGHRRHRACLELGLPLLAMVTELSDRELFETMERENRARKNLSAWEQGGMYKRALDEGLYPSQRKLSESLGVDVSLVSKSLSLARLPDAVVMAFASPLEIQFRWAQPLAEALQKDPDALISRAQRIQQAGQPMPASKVLAMLLGADELPALNGSTPQHRVIQGSAGRQALMTRDTRGRVMVKFAAGVLSDAEETALAAAIERLLQRA